MRIARGVVASWRRIAVASATLAAFACTDDKRPTTPVPVVAGPNKEDVITISAVNVNLDQYANGKNNTTENAEWQNGNLNGNNSSYAEGLAVPFRLAIEGLTPGTHTITIQYDWTAGGHKAYDFLASIDATQAGMLGIICATGGGGRSSLCGASTTTMPAGPATEDEPFPGDDFLDPQSQKTVDGAITFSGLGPTGAAGKRKMTIYGGSITSIGVPTHVGNFDTGNSTAGFLVTFVSNGSAVLLTWSGHLGQSAYWNSSTDPDGAGQVSGAPWHMRTQNLDDGGGAQQDRSIQPSALVGSPDMELLKTADAATVDAGSPIGFTITVSNFGNGDAANVALNDPLPGGSGIDWSIAGTTGTPTCSITGSPPNETLSCTKNPLAAGANFSVHVTSNTTPASCAVYNNTATVTGSGFEQLQAQASTTVQCPDISIVKTPDAQTKNAGETLVFDVVVANAGPGTAKAAALNDPLPGGSGVNWSIVAGFPTGQGGFTPPSCNITGSAPNQTLACAAKDIPSGQGYTVKVSTNTTAASCQIFNNTATVSGSNFTSENDAGDITVTCPNISIVKTPDGQTKNAGEAISFSIVVANAAGSGTAAAVALNDPLPGGTGVNWSLVAGSPTGQGGFTPPSCSIGGSAPNQTLTCDAINIPGGQGYTVAVTSNTTAASCKKYDNTATISGSNFSSKNDAGDITVKCPDVSIVKTPDGQTKNAGEAISFSIVVANAAGNGTATAVALNDPLPGGTGVSWSLVAGSPTGQGGLTPPSCSIGGSAPNQTLTCDAVNIPGGQGYTVAVTSNTTEASCKKYDNTATISGSNFTSKNDAGDITVTCPSISIVKTPDGQTKNAGEAISFSIVVANAAGNGTATAVALNDPLPGGTGVNWTLVAGSPTGQGGLTPPSCSIGGSAPNQTLTCDAVNIPGGQGYTVAVTSNTTAASCKKYDNTATVSGTNFTSKNDAGDITVTCPNISVVKTPDGQTKNAGEAISFSVVVANAAGSGTATAVTLNDALPGGTGVNWSIVAGTPSGQGGLTPPSCSIQGSAPTQTLTCGAVNIPGGQGYTVTVTSATTAESCKAYNNTATASGTNFSDKNDAGDITVKCPDISVVKTPDGQTKNAGDVISFDVVVANAAGAGIAKAVALNDPLPGGPGVNWSIAPTYPQTTGGLSAPTCSVTGSAPSQTLSCAAKDIAGGQGYTVRVQTNTAFASCKLYNNQAATVSGSNFPSESDAGDITVNCPDLTIVKTPDAGVVQNGGTMVFGIRVTNAGPGLAKAVALSDPLPAGDGVSPANWTIVATYPQGIGNLTPPTCSITGAAGSQTLGCVGINIGANQGYEVRVQAVTTPAICGTFNNTATFTSTNHASESDDGSIEVNCVKGCTLTIGFWKNHAGLGSGNQGDSVTKYLPILLGNAGGPQTVTVTTAGQARTILSTMGSNGIDKLKAQLLGTKLNLANQSPAGFPGLQAAITAADLFLSTHNSASWDGLSKADQKSVINWMTFFDNYNNTGPHCP